MSNILNFYNPNGFIFKIHRLPNLSLTVQNVKLPDISAGDIRVPTPFKNFPVPTDRLDFSPLEITYLVDENLTNYFSVVDWMFGLYYPNSFDERLALETRQQGDGLGKVSDCTLILLNNQKNPVKTLIFKDAFPKNINIPDMSSETTDVQPVKANLTLEFSSFSYE